MSDYPQLTLPPFAANVKKKDSRPVIFDILRRRFVALTPEEWVRQHFIHYLIEHKGYSPTLMANEVTITLNGMSRRCDSVLYSREGLQPRMIIEYKAANIPITQHVFDQITRYNMVLQVEYLVISNGIQHYCCRLNYETQQYTFINDVPEYSELQNI